MISVIVPVYNTEKYLDRCIQSILSQTYTDFELLLVDDGSTDSSGAICDRYADLDSRVRVFHKENGGCASARRIGVENAKGDFISFCDSDDGFFLNALEILVNNITSNEIDIVISDCAFNDTISGDEFVRKTLLWSLSASVCWGRVYRKSILDVDSFNVPRELIVGEDLFMNIKTGLKVRLCVCIKDTIYDYRSNPDSITNTRKISLKYEEFYISEIIRALGSRVDEFKDELYNIKLGALEMLIVCKVPVSYDREWVKDLIQWGVTRKLSVRHWVLLNIKNNLLAKYILAIEKRVRKFLAI